MSRVQPLERDDKEMQKLIAGHNFAVFSLFLIFSICDCRVAFSCREFSPPGTRISSRASFMFLAICIWSRNNLCRFCFQVLVMFCY